MPSLPRARVAGYVPGFAGDASLPECVQATSSQYSCTLARAIESDPASWRSSATRKTPIPAKLQTHQSSFSDGSRKVSTAVRSLPLPPT